MREARFTARQWVQAGRDMASRLDRYDSPFGFRSAMCFAEEGELLSLALQTSDGVSRGWLWYVQVTWIDLRHFHWALLPLRAVLSAVIGLSMRETDKSIREAVLDELARRNAEKQEWRELADKDIRSALAVQKGPSTVANKLREVQGWVTSQDGELFTGQLWKTKEEAEHAGLQAADGEDSGTYVAPALRRHWPEDCVMADDVLEAIEREDDFAHIVNIQPTEENKADLEATLRAAVGEWLRRYNLYPIAWDVDGDQIYFVESSDATTNSTPAAEEDAAESDEQAAVTRVPRADDVACSLPCRDCNGMTPHHFSADGLVVCDVCGVYYGPVENVSYGVIHALNKKKESAVGES